eukprot:gene4339-4592_t
MPTPVLAHLDLDAFYTQVEAKRNPELRGQPLVVVQYNPYGDLRTLKPSDNRLFPESNGSIIAASYEARAFGVNRNMMAQQAKKLCPQLSIVQVPVAHGKADLTIYREAGAAVISVLSNSEFDVVDLFKAGMLLERIRVQDQLGFTCSAGIAHSKILAKLGSGLHKPAQQTLVPAAAVQALLRPLPLPKLRQLGGKFGEEVMAGLGVTTVGELAAVPMSKLVAQLGEETAAWLARLAQGRDDEEVKPRLLPKSVSCGKTFRGKNALTGLTAVHSWLQQLGLELEERLQADRDVNS